MSRREYHSAAVITTLGKCCRFRCLCSCVFVSISGWVIVVWQLAEIWTITELSLLKYTFVTLTGFPFALMRRVPGRTSRMGIPPEALANSVQPDRHVPALGSPCSGVKGVDGVGTGGATWPRWTWSGRCCTYLSVSLDQMRTVEDPSICVTKPWTTQSITGFVRVEILSPSLNCGPVSVQFSRVSRGCIKSRSIRISREPWVGKSTVAIRSPWVVQWAEIMPSSATVRHGWCWHALGRAKKVLPIWNC